MTGSSGTPVSGAQATEVLSDPWRVLTRTIHAVYLTGNMVTGGEFVAKIIEASEVAGHHPDIDLRYGSVHLALTTHSAHRLTEADVALANRIAEIAREMDLQPTVDSPATFELAIDARDIASVKPFWRAVLGYTDKPEATLDDLVDPHGILPAVWFQQMDEPRPQRSRMHVDLWPDSCHFRVSWIGGLSLPGVSF
ncbi:4a-hydroxytetrahydrobiopterin dehydratase [Gordonia sp. PP30]|uniref:4a-hydroxytetrahydrobiopterin dehydratase n=1 Tax=Gordonia sp. PP30 TaxID=2935861 RepID=UPI001FFF7414|nr:4a-hydroxytetrahydrobiopterin dehydratase [Gordonia sp. PP30]UQE75252.1 4a-hydroxytetrahydrobiopterin dehydratase [Gordonia sp. PP30]